MNVLISSAPFDVINRSRLLENGQKCLEVHETPWSH